MGIGVDHMSPEKIILWAPFEKNINHKKTVFGGSLHSVAALCCWSLIHMHLLALEQKYQIVITKSVVEYTAPVTSDFKAECCLPGAKQWDHFINTLQKRGKARITLHAKICQEDNLCVDFTGVYAAFQLDE
jgi:thioesterase domain-containing protein